MDLEIQDVPSYDPEKIRPDEVFWRDRYDWLKDAGYQLRPRYKPDWIPSWRTSNQNPFYAEDGIAAPVGPRQPDLALGL